MKFLLGKALKRSDERLKTNNGKLEYALKLREKNVEKPKITRELTKKFSEGSKLFNLKRTLKVGEKSKKQRYSAVKKENDV